MNLKTLIKKFFTHYLEETFENIEIISLLKNRTNLEILFQNIDKEIDFVLTSTTKEIENHYEKLGEVLYLNKISFIIIINVIEKLKNEILYAINKEKIKYDENEFLLKINTIEKSISKKYFLLTIKDLTNTTLRNLSLEIDINIHKKWYLNFLNSLFHNKNPKKFLIFEESECFKWINSLDFKLLSKASDLNTTNEIILLIEKIFELAREIVFYKEKENFTNAYSFLIILDQKINILSNILENISIMFINDKTNYFFELFSDIILFKKEYAYFLIFSLKTKINYFQKNSLSKIFLQIFNKIKEKVKSLNYDITGIINDFDTIHFLVAYKNKNELKNIFDFIINTIENYKNNELIINIPDLCLTATNTEYLSGLNAKTLKKLAFLMTKKIKTTPYYHFEENELIELIKEAKKEIEIDTKIEKAIKNNELNLFFQPIIHYKNGEKTLEYCEVLSRIKFKNKHIDMQNFINHIVEKNLNDEFDMVVYKKLLELIPKIKQYINGISLNIFPSSFVNSNVINLLKQVIKKCKENNMFLVLEILEYHIFEHYNIIKKLKDEFPNTLKIALDDFGSGYSSFSILIHLSKNNLLDTIKIDGSITKEITNDEISFEILKMSLEIAKKLNKKVIIEYVENKEIEEKIKTITNDFYAQGFYYSKAIPLEKLKELIF